MIPPPPHSAIDRRAVIADGRILRFPPGPASLQLVERAFALVGQYLPADLAREPDSFERLTRARRALLADAGTLESMAALLQVHGMDPDDCLVDAPRLRAVASGGHRNPAAAPAYYTHRDTWYANPPAQLNWWIALSDVRRAEAVVFWPTHFDRPIANDSVRFDYESWIRSGGWQSPGRPPERAFPRATEPPAPPAAQVAMNPGELMVFAGAHLHASPRHDSGSTRFSLEFRTVNQSDIARGLTPPTNDDRSRGSTIGAMTPLAELGPKSFAAAEADAGQLSVD